MYLDDVYEQVCASRSDIRILSYESERILMVVGNVSVCDGGTRKNLVNLTGT